MYMACTLTTKRLTTFLASTMLAIGTLSAQQSVNPFTEVLTYANINTDNLKKDFPQLKRVLNKDGYTIADVSAWAKDNPKEWDAFRNLPEVSKLNIAWATVGIAEPVKAPEFKNSFYQWYKAANISDAKRSELFPHFPLPDLNADVEKEAIAYDEKVGAWQRLYPQEYETFLNTPELTALNPYYTGYYTLPYMPRFIGQNIGLEKPVKENTGNDVADEFNYQMKLRNWYFVFEPEQFNTFYGKDYKFPADFDAQAYREYTIRILNETKAGTYPKEDNPH